MRLDKSDYFLLIAVLISFLYSIYNWFLVDKQTGLYVAIWVPSLLAAGSYLKARRGVRNDG